MWCVHWLLCSVDDHGVSKVQEKIEDLNWIEVKKEPK